MEALLVHKQNTKTVEKLYNITNIIIALFLAWAAAAAVVESCVDEFDLK